VIAVLARRAPGHTDADVIQVTLRALTGWGKDRDLGVPDLIRVG
jgi:hypothetical protein